MRDAYNDATIVEPKNPYNIPTYQWTIKRLDDLGIPPEYRDHVLFLRPMTAEEASELERVRKMLADARADCTEEKKKEIDEFSAFKALHSAEEIKALEKEFARVA